MKKKVESLVIEGVEYVPKGSVSKASIQDDLPARIVVADRGFVYAGLVEEHDDGSLTVHSGVNVRSYGTKNGLGELGISGPTASTKLDPVPTVLIPRHAVMHQLAILESANWKF